MTKKKIARTKRGTKRAAEKPVDQEIQRAAERAGIRPFTSRDRAARNLVREVGDYIIQASDMLAEHLADLVSSREFERLHHLGEIHHRIWQVRWELGLRGKDVRASNEDVARVTNDMTKTAAGGGS